MIFKNIAKLRHKHHLTQDQVAKQLGLSRSQYSHIETGRNELSVSTLLKLAQLYDVSTDYLLE
ncbi:MAG: helix-turn-helix domain-containing protein [Bavariicoccus seileri]|uniref:XRE family transcriptional regulator n=1 Tax=Bavariicoccus seileri TaxID=549685 RepID=A0A3D4S4L3_9ENTE|nr:helix-turn-helix transcriptional regulator [Bavariicoccus seileri]HCS93422.1 XRE family transcriptional regulator [Bavariicoccus seileri]